MLFFQSFTVEEGSKLIYILRNTLWEILHESIFRIVAQIIKLAVFQKSYLRHVLKKTVI